MTIIFNCKDRIITDRTSNYAGGSCSDSDKMFTLDDGVGTNCGNPIWMTLFPEEFSCYTIQSFMQVLRDNKDTVEYKDAAEGKSTVRILVTDTNVSHIARKGYCVEIQFRKDGPRLIDGTTRSVSSAWLGSGSSVLDSAVAVFALLDDWAEKLTRLSEHGAGDIVDLDNMYSCLFENPSTDGVCRLNRRIPLSVIRLVHRIVWAEWTIFCRDSYQRNSEHDTFLEVVSLKGGKAGQPVTITNQYAIVSLLIEGMYYWRCAGEKMNMYKSVREGRKLSQQLLMQQDKVDLVSTDYCHIVEGDI